MTLKPQELTVEQVRPLRRAVLRAGMPVQDVEWVEDSYEGVFHLGIVDGGRVVAVSTWIPQTPPDDIPAPERSVHLRGMATDPEVQSRGLGGRLLESGCAEAQRRGYESVWAWGRDAALDFYRRHDFTVVEPGFIERVTQLPHHPIYRRLV